MRTDVKIGVLVGLFILLVVVVYLLYSLPKNPQESARTTPTPTVRPTPTNRTAPSPTPPQLWPLPTPSTSPAPTALTPAPTAAPVISSTVISVAPTPAVTPTPTLHTMTPPLAVPTPAPTPAASPRAARDYVVAAGDSLSSIAAKEYGSSRYWYLIAEANQGLDPNRLPIGRKLVIPPQPTPTPAPGGSAVTGGGSTPVVPGPGMPAGWSPYTVKQGDSGYWAIASKVYGDGSLYHLLIEANPGISSDRLQPGMVLKVPPKPSNGGTTTRPSAVRSTVVTPATAPASAARRSPTPTAARTTSEFPEPVNP